MNEWIRTTDLRITTTLPTELHSLQIDLIDTSILPYSERDLNPHDQLANRF